MKSLSQFVGQMRETRSRLEKPKEFFVEHRTRYELLARSVVRQTLAALRPAESDPEEWDRNVERYARAVTAIVTANPLGIRLRTSAEDRGDEEAAKGGPGGKADIGYDDVLEWVRAGMEGDPEGKDLTAAESGRNEYEIAFQVYEAIEQYRLAGVSKKDYSRITRRLEEWVTRSTQLKFAEFAAAIAAAWLRVFAPLYAEDFNLHVRATMRTTLR